MLDERIQAEAPGPWRTLRFPHTPDHPPSGQADAETSLLDWDKVRGLGLGRIVALHYCSSTSYHIRYEIRYLIY